MSSQGKLGNKRGDAAKKKAESDGKGTLGVGLSAIEKECTRTHPDLNNQQKQTLFQVRKFDLNSQRFGQEVNDPAVNHSHESNGQFREYQLFKSGSSPKSAKDAVYLTEESLPLVDAVSYTTFHQQECRRMHPDLAFQLGDKSDVDHNSKFRDNQVLKTGSAPGALMHTDYLTDDGLTPVESPAYSQKTLLRQPTRPMARSPKKSFSRGDMF